MLYRLVLLICIASASAFVAPLSVRSQSMAAISMDEKKAAPKKKEAPPPKPKVPGEGDPFGDVAQAYSEANKDGGSAYQPRAISDASVIDAYQTIIESDDEPWHATCRPVAVVGLDGLEYAARPLDFTGDVFLRSSSLDAPPTRVLSARIAHLSLAGRPSRPTSRRRSRLRRTVASSRLAVAPRAGPTSAFSARRTTTPSKLAPA